MTCAALASLRSCTPVLSLAVPRGERNPLENFPKDFHHFPAPTYSSLYRLTRTHRFPSSSLLLAMRLVVTRTRESFRVAKNKFTRTPEAEISREKRGKKRRHWSKRENRRRKSEEKRHDPTVRERKGRRGKKKRVNEGRRENDAERSVPPRVQRAHAV